MSIWEVIVLSVIRLTLKTNYDRLLWIANFDKCVRQLIGIEGDSYGFSSEVKQYSSVTLFGIDIYKQHINKDADEKTVVKYGKTFGIVLAIAAMFIAPLLLNAESLFAYLQKVNGIYSIPILTIIVVGFLTKRVPAIAAKIGLISGMVLYLGYLVIDEMMDGNFPLHFLDVMAILFVLNVVIMLVIGKIRPRETDYVQEYTGQVDITPWKYVKQAGITICVIVIGVYVYFA